MHHTPQDRVDAVDVIVEVAVAAASARHEARHGLAQNGHLADHLSVLVVILGGLQCVMQHLQAQASQAVALVWLDRLARSALQGRGDEGVQPPGQWIDVRVGDGHYLLSSVLRVRR